MRKSLVVLLLFCFILSGCKGTTVENADIFKLNESVVVDHEKIEDGNYTVLDVRETQGGNNVREFYIVNVVLENDNNTRFYYSYYCRDLKDSGYLMTAKLVPGDKVTCTSNYLYLNQ